MSGRKNTTAFMDAIISSINSLVESGVTTGIAASFGNTKKSLLLNEGFTDDKKENRVCGNTVFDLASVTKLFLTFAFFSVNESSPIHFDKELEYYCGNMFPHIKHITLDELFHFECSLITDMRITECDYLQAKKQILNIKPHPYEKPTYSDMSALVLGFVFKKITGVDFGTFINGEMINRFRLKNTFWGKNNKSIESFMNYDNEAVIKNGRIKTYKQQPLIVNDRKAEILSDNGKYLCGNAGLFSTPEDMTAIAMALINRDFLNNSSLMNIASKANTNFPQRFGYLCYCKSPDKTLSEIYHKMSDKAFAISGFTGTHFMIDPINNCFLFIGANRLNNRVTYVDNNKLIIDDTTVRHNGEDYNYSKEYVYLKDSLRDACCEWLLNEL